MWRPSQKCGGQVRNVEAKLEMWKPSQKCEGKVSNVEAKLEMWRPSQKCGGKVSNVEAKLKMWRPSRKSTWWPSPYNPTYLTENSVDDQQGSLFNIVDTSGQ